MKKTIIYILIIFLFGCDCIQEIEGYIVDDNSEMLIEGVRIWKKQRPHIIEESDSDGFFKYYGISGGIRKCADIDLIFEKEGYERLEKTFPAYNPKKVEIRLIKDLSKFESIRSEIIDTVKRIELDNFISTGVVGISGKKPKQFSRRAWLMSKAENDELIKLIEYPNAVVKATAFEGLYKRGNPEIAKILIKLSNQNELIYFRSGCTGYPIQIGEYCFTKIMNYDLSSKKRIEPPLPDEFKRQIKLSENEKEIIIKNIKKKTAANNG
jgi:hypothetical protein